MEEILTLAMAPFRQSASPEVGSHAAPHFSALSAQPEKATRQISSKGLFQLITAVPG